MSCISVEGIVNIFVLFLFSVVNFVPWTVFDLHLLPRPLRCRLQDLQGKLGGFSGILGGNRSFRSRSQGALGVLESRLGLFKRGRRGLTSLVLGFHVICCINLRLFDMVHEIVQGGSLTVEFALGGRQSKGNLILAGRIYQGLDGALGLA